ncbi:MAG: phosphonate ABC transporter substrate-binding protein [Candidatus Methylomirabilia bacterium]
MKLARTAVAIAALVTAIASPAAAEDPRELNFGVISTESQQGLRKGFEPFFEEMSKSLGVKVNGFYASDYAGVIEGMRFNKVHLAWFGNKSAMEAVDRADGEVFAQTVDAQGNPGYWSLLLVHKDSPYQSVDDLVRNAKNITFANGDPNSTSGYLIPSYYVWGKLGIDPAKTFKRMTNANHETNAISVAEKKVDFATNNTENLQIIEKNNPTAFAKLRVVWKSPLIPSDPLVWRKDLSREMKAKIKGFILSYGRVGPDAARQRQILAAMSSGWAPFNDSNNLQLVPIREIALAKDRMKIESKEKASSEDTAKLAKIKTELQALANYRTLLEQFKEF